ncbi:WXG100-like domain-containing protein [Nocardia rhamnosiphila]
MSIHIPTEVVFFLNALGIPYPDVDVDQVREMAHAVDEFAKDVRRTFDESTSTIEGMESVLSGETYQSILVLWSHNSGKMAELETAFDVTSTALDIAADVIEAVQIAVLIELAALAASFIASMFTPAAPVTGPVLAAAARQIAKALAEFIIGYIAGELLAKALEPMLEKFNEYILDSLKPPDSSVPTSGGDGKVYMDPDGVDNVINTLDSQAREMQEHGDKLGNRLSELDFSTPGLDVPTEEFPGQNNMFPTMDGIPPSLLPSIFPDLVPGAQQPSNVQQPTVEEPSTNASAPASGSSVPGDPRTDAGTAPSVDASSDPGAGQSAPGAPGTVPSSAPGSALSPTGISSGGAEPSGQAGHAAETRSIAPESAGIDSDTAGSAPAQQHSGVSPGMGMVPQAATTQSTQAAAGAQAGAGSSQPGAASNGQRPADAAAGKSQGGAGRGAGGAGGSGGSDARQQPSDRKVSKTPWSRAGGTAGRNAPTTKRSDEKIPAVSAAEPGPSREEALTTPTVAGGVPQVFAPTTAAPPPATAAQPPEQADNKSTGDDRDQDVPVAAPTKDAEHSGAGARPPAG